MTAASNRHPSGQIVKYRPAFTLKQIEHIAAILQTDSENLDTDSVKLSKSIVAILVPLLAKISNNLIEPSYAVAIKVIPLTIVSRPHTSSDQYRYENDLMSAEEQITYESFILGLGS